MENQPTERQKTPLKVRKNRTDKPIRVTTKAEPKHEPKPVKEHRYHLQYQVDAESDWSLIKKENDLDLAKSTLRSKKDLMSRLHKAPKYRVFDAKESETVYEI